ncbi:MAG: hypothetical protein J6U63_02330 [Clostridia bacterium]|nr:hypothetical protein [Clostridia bacterium]
MACALVLIGSVAFAQNDNRDNKKDGGKDWREKVRAAQVSFLTTELDLTEAEAQAFWPVYNEVQKQRHEAFRAQGEAMKAMKDAKGNANALIDQYLDAKKKMNDIDAEAIAKYKKVLPAEKVAKLILAQEKFLHQQIDRLGKGGRTGEGFKPGQGGRPGQGAKPGNGWQGPRKGKKAETQDAPAA